MNDLSHVSGLLAQAISSAPATAAALTEAAEHADSLLKLGINLAYLVSAALFIFGLKMMSHPRSARRGNLLSAVGMLIAIVVTLGDKEIVSWWTIGAGLITGSVIGAVLALRVQMTAMPQMVGMLNGFGGLGSATVAFAEFLRVYFDPLRDPRLDTLITIGLSALIGMVTFTGSVTAYGKLEGWKIKGRSISNPLLVPRHHLLSIVLLLVCVGLGVLMTRDYQAGLWAIIALYLIAAVLGVMAVIPIGGADMPVVISLLNSYSGLAAMTTGFALDNYCLIISGSLVGASGIILTKIMCNAMNRSLLNVVAGGFGQELSSAGATSAEGKTVRQMDAEEAVMVLEAAQKVFIIPGYGMAVAQAQHAVAEMAAQLGKKGVEVRYGVHPVAGRMPGHMNVLLAEANVPYEQLADLELNSEMDQCDVALVIGANDVVNPAARHDRGSPIFGMPIFDVDKAKTVMVFKRSLNPGFAGIENELFYLPNTVMVFGDAKKMVSSIVSELKGH
ncbi:MAG TPA: NAD(P)(+) transhydrogenase (Re/Si-specific) subunit beta [Phycisphaerae bacterium]|jgi:NAD(P) transhydrogenase subunit beta|nr:NAD(P)(+) transhydrogenase (Re/Si-specific) subunit beta [Phycisphaerae bacterium]HPM22688.1 NAD(P)(+) transhydrogenase (Re/Si-specific) subunit beta [Phycisphaerae bacterium]